MIPHDLDMTLEETREYTRFLNKLQGKGNDMSPKSHSIKGIKGEKCKAQEQGRNVVTASKRRKIKDVKFLERKIVVKCTRGGGGCGTNSQEQEGE